MASTMAKSTVAVALLVMVMICFHVESVSAGEMGGHAVRSSKRNGGINSSSSKHKRHHHHHYSSRHCRIPQSSICSNSSAHLEPEPEPDYLEDYVFKLLTLSWLAAIVYMFLSILFGIDSVIMVQVAFRCADGQIWRDLDLISDTKDSTPDSRTQHGLQSLLSETASCLYRYRESYFSASSNVNKKWSLTGGWKKIFQLTYNMERNKVHDLFNDCGAGTRCERATCPNNKYVIVTILVAADRKCKLPAINCYSDLEKALHSLTSIDHTYIQAVRVLWTSRDDMEDFPSLIRP